MKVVSVKDAQFERLLKQAVNRGAQQNAKAEKAVKSILDAVERRGDAAISQYVKKFDGLTLSARRFRVTAAELHQAERQIEPKAYSALRFAARRVRTVSRTPTPCHLVLSEAWGETWPAYSDHWMQWDYMCRVERPFIRHPFL